MNDMSDKPEFNGSSHKGRPVYLDYQATTPVDPLVVEAMLPFFTEKFGNPHSRSHLYGWEAGDAVERAREQVAALIGAGENEIIFTSGATESNNLAIKGVARLHKDHRNHIVTCATEHKCVLEACATLEYEGFAVTVLPVSDGGLIDLDQLSDAVTDNTSLVSSRAVNNEIGAIQPLAEIGALCRERGAFFHTDAAQAAGKIGLDVDVLSIDLMSLTAHKFYGPKGIGALYVRRRPRVRLEAMIDGGGQERGLRSGTLPAPLCVGFGLTAEIAAEVMDEEGARLTALRDRFLETILPRVDGIQINGDMEHRIPGNLNLSFAGIQAEDLMAGLKDLAVSSGSACTSESVEPSYVLKAIGLSDELAAASIRIGFGRFTTEQEINFAADTIAAEVERLRQVKSIRQTSAA